MQYKTIVLELIRDRLEFHEQLRSTKRLLPTMDAYASDLRDSHHAWIATLKNQRPGSDPSQIRSEALELALHELTERLPSAPSPIEGL